MRNEKQNAENYNSRLLRPPQSYVKQISKFDINLKVLAMTLNENFVVDAKGKKVSVPLPIERKECN